MSLMATPVLFRLFCPELRIPQCCKYELENTQEACASMGINTVLVRNVKLLALFYVLFFDR